MRRRALGFSLLETIVALGIFAALLATIEASLFTSHKALATLLRRADPAADSLVARRVFERWVGALAPPPQSAEQPGPILAGGRDRLDFFAAVEGDEGGVTLWAVEFAIVEGPNGRATRLEMRRRQPGSSRAPEVSPLLDWRHPLAFAYLVGEARGGAHWTSDPGQAAELPSQIQVKAADGPILSAPVVLQENGRCLVEQGLEAFGRGACRVR